MITNNDGEVQVTYTAGSSPVWVEIYAEHVYYYPHGAGEIVAADAKFISVKQSPADVWDLRATVNVRVNVTADTSWSIIIPNLPTITDFRSLYESYSGKLTVFGLIQNECGGYGNDFCYTGNDPPILWFAYGDAAEFSKNKSTEYLNGVLEIFGEMVTFCNELAVGSELRTDNYRIRTDDVGVYLEYGDNIKYFDVSGYGDGEANYNRLEWLSGGYWETFEGTYSRSGEVQTSWTEPDPFGSFTYQDSAYSFGYNGTETIFQPHYEYGTIQTTITKNLNGKIKPYYRTITDVDNKNSDLILIPKNYDLKNYPNPFNPSTRIQYQIPSVTQVTLKVYDVLGNEVATLINEEKPAGMYEVEFSLSSIKHNPSSGVYFCRLQTENFSKTIKMLYLK
ncbi:MAG: T9SS type A sorting domain-containing protein [Ignavibacteriaceae bacterium]|nr:T9SS type A sorting domain-containing protein [Ignavibacteriaceae bacterium]